MSRRGVFEALILERISYHRKKCLALIAWAQHCIVIQANSDGVRGSGKRVPRAFPVFNRWQAEFDFLITDNIITEAIFEETIKAAGVIVGLGRFRAEKGGRNGRFNVTRIDWEDFKT